MVDKSGFEEKVAFVIGAVSIALAFWQPIVGLVLGILGMNLAKQKTSVAMKAKNLSKIGIILNVIIIVLALIALVIGISGILGVQNFPAG